MEDQPPNQNKKMELPKFEFSQYEKYFNKSESYYLYMIFKLYFLNRSYVSYNFILKNNYEFENVYIPELDLDKVDVLDFHKIFNILSSKPSIFDDLILNLNAKDQNVEIAKDFIANVYFPSQFAFFFCSFFQKKAADFILKYIETRSKFSFRIAASFISSSNKFKESLLKTFFENKAKNHSQNDCHVLIQSFFEILYLLTEEQYQVFTKLFEKSKKDAAEITLKYILSPIVRSWEYSDFFTGTDILYTNFDAGNADAEETKRCQLLKMLEEESNSMLEFVEDLYSSHQKDTSISFQETIDVEELIQLNYVNFAFNKIEYQIYLILSKINDLPNNPKIQDMVNVFYTLLLDSQNLFSFKISSNRTKITTKNIGLKNPDIPKDLEDDYQFFKKAKVEVSETLQDFTDYYDRSLRKSFEYVADNDLHEKAENTMEMIKKNAEKAYQIEVKHSENERENIAERMIKARLLKDEIASTENVTDDIILKLVFKYHHNHFNLDNLMNQSSQLPNDVDVLKLIIDDTADNISNFIKKDYNINELKSLLEKFVVSCEEPEKIIYFLESRKDNNNTIFTNKSSIYRYGGNAMMMFKFERAKFIYIFSKRSLILKPSNFKISKEKSQQQIENFHQIFQPYQCFNDIGILLGNQIQISFTTNIWLQIIHYLKLLSLIFQIKYSISLFANNDQTYNSDLVDPCLFFNFVNKNPEDNLLNSIILCMNGIHIIDLLFNNHKGLFKRINKNIINVIKNSFVPDESESQPIEENSDLFYINQCNMDLTKFIENFIGYFM